MKHTNHEKTYVEGQPTVAFIRSLKYPLGMTIKVPHKLGYGAVEYQEYQIIGIYPDYVLCQRTTAKGDTYTKCFLKSELYFKAIETEDDDDR